MYYVVMDIGCLECGLPSYAIGIFTEECDASKAVRQARKEYEKYTGIPDRQVYYYVVKELNTVQSKEDSD